MHDNKNLVTLYSMNELLDALERYKSAAALARALQISPHRVRMWKSRGIVPAPWPQILKTMRPKEKK
jgi:hypothetical protein